MMTARILTLLFKSYLVTSDFCPKRMKIFGEKKAYLDFPKALYVQLVYEVNN